jgi:hypothetical protein
MSKLTEKAKGINFDEDEDEVAPPAPAPVADKPRTAMGAISASLALGRGVEAENRALKAKRQKFEDAAFVEFLDSKLVKPSRWANRHALSFSGPEFATLKAEIADAGRNVQPIKVRPLAVQPGQPQEYEIAYGHRRHRACLELGQQHHAEPAQAAYLDEMAARGAHRVTVDAACGNARTSPALNGVVHAQHDGTFRHEGAHQQPQQQTRAGQRRPRRAAQDAMEVHEMPLVSQAQHAQHPCHRACPRHQHGTHEQQLGMAPGSLTKQRGEAQNDLREAGRHSRHDFLPWPREQSVYEPVRFAFTAVEWPKSSSESVRIE